MVVREMRFKKDEEHGRKSDMGAFRMKMQLSLKKAKIPISGLVINTRVMVIWG